MHMSNKNKYVECSFLNVLSPLEAMHDFRRVHIQGGSRLKHLLELASPEALLDFCEVHIQGGGRLKCDCLSDKVLFVIL